MDNVVLPPWAAKAISFWTTICAMMMLIGTKLVTLPDWAPALFSNETTQIIMVVLSTFIGTFQYFRTKVFAKKSAEIKTLSTKSKLAYFINPLKMAA